MPGLFELLILAGLVGVPVVIAVCVLIVVLGNKRGTGSPPANLVPCPDCRQGVSPRAQHCPHCGAPLKPSA